MSPALMLIALLGAHFLCDYPLQGDFLAKAKNRTAPIPGVPWWQALLAHAAIHGAAVALITGIWWLSIAEAGMHAWIDDTKCQGRFSYNADQWLHIHCKLCWWAVAMNLATRAA